MNLPLRPSTQVVEITSKEAAEMSLAVVDDSLDKDFYKNDAGWKRNDFSLAARAETLEQYTAIMARLNNSLLDVGKDGGRQSKGLTREQGIALLKPRYCQSYTELQMYSDYVSSLDFVNEKDNALVEKFNPKSDEKDPESTGSESSAAAE